jgi:hypothetical protein
VLVMNVLRLAKPTCGNTNNEELLNNTFKKCNFTKFYNDGYQSSSCLVQELQQNAWTMKYG